MIRIGITLGDPNGIGPEVVVKSLANSDILELFTPVVFGDPTLILNTAKALKLEDFHFDTLRETGDITDGVINVVDISNGEFVATPGVASQEAGSLAVASLEAAGKAVEDGNIDLLVTAPIDKCSAQSEGFHFAGHTEYLEDRFGLQGSKAMMILADGGLRVSLVTTHLPLKDVAPHITKDNVGKAIRSFNMALKMDFGCERPKIAVLSLNPHCGDNGVHGTEEKDEIIPAIDECRNEGILAFGPVAADGLFGSGAYANFDGILAMYHDQGLAPFKALAGSHGVNFTAGLNIIRTSPDHGTAYDKAGRGISDETSMREAIYAAIDIARRRAAYLDASENPLEIKAPAPRGKRQKERNAEDDPTIEDVTE